MDFVDVFGGTGGVSVDHYVAIWRQQIIISKLVYCVLHLPDLCKTYVMNHGRETLFTHLVCTINGYIIFLYEKCRLSSSGHFRYLLGEVC
jgi:hypothetical protein